MVVTLPSTDYEVFAVIKLVFEVNTLGHDGGTCLCRCMPHVQLIFSPPRIFNRKPETQPGGR